MSTLILALYLALPAFVANMMPVVFARWQVLPSYAIPIDGGRLWRGKPLLGANKTWRGVIGALLGAVVIVLVQYTILAPVYVTHIVYETLFFALLYGVWVGVLAMFGDALGSILKRQLGFKSGQPFLVVDQVDYIVLFIIGTLFFVHWTASMVIVLLVVTFFLNLVTNALSYVAGIKNTAW